MLHCESAWFTFQAARSLLREARQNIKLIRRSVSSLTHSLACSTFSVFTRRRILLETPARSSNFLLIREQESDALALGEIVSSGLARTRRLPICEAAGSAAANYLRVAAAAHAILIVSRILAACGIL